MDGNISTKILEIISTPFYLKWDFWLFIIIGLIGTIFAILAFIEARRAKTAATAAGNTVKIQTITIELSEIRQRLGKLDTEIKYSDARDLLNEVTGKLRRQVSPFKNEQDLKETIDTLLKSLEAAKEALKTVRPIHSEASQEDIENNSVYFATESHFSNISGCVADLMGLFEKRSIDFRY